GRLTVVLDDEEQSLETGDSLTFVGLHRHEMKNLTDEQVDALIVMTPAPM
ncbi:MAG: cupin domain-containing protein, partial [Actinobacteria bacterium]|nr:cupin domain-containing protein [Actinomycetota bacterium]